MYMSQSGEAYAVERRRVKGNFLENLELQEFPFDIQVRQTKLLQFPVDIQVRQNKLPVSL